MALRVLMCDMDNTLVLGGEDIYKRNLQEVAARVGFDLTDEFFKSTLLGKPVSQYADLIRETGASFSMDGKDYTAEADRLYLKHIQDSGAEPRLRVRPGFENALRALSSRDVALFIVTNCERDIAHIVLEATGLNRIFERSSVLTYNDVVDMGLRPKPSGAAFHHIREKQGVHPYECLVLGDSGSDIFGAVEAGIPAVQFADFSDPLDKHPKVADSLVPLTILRGDEDLNEVLSPDRLCSTRRFFEASPR